MCCKSVLLAPLVNSMPDTEAIDRVRFFNVLMVDPKQYPSAALIGSSVDVGPVPIGIIGPSSLLVVETAETGTQEIATSWQIDSGEPVAEIEFESPTWIVTKGCVITRLLIVAVCKACVVVPVIVTSFEPISVPLLAPS